MVIRHIDPVKHKAGMNFRRREGSELKESDRATRSESVLGRVNDDPEALKQREWDDVKPVGEEVICY